MTTRTPIRSQWPATATVAFGAMIFLAAAILEASGCGSSSSDDSQTSANDASAEAASSSDAASPDASRDAEAAAPLFGDRNLGLIEPYPDMLLIQNGGRFYNLRKPPTAAQHAALGDGVTDDTAAFQDAYDYLKQKLLTATGVPGNTNLHAPNSQAARDLDTFWLYVPDGTYLVSDTLYYRGQGLQQYYAATYSGSNPFGTPWFDLTRIRLVGQSREGTILKLADAAVGFGDPTKPKPVVTFQHPMTTFNDWNADNLMKNITVDVGNKNPGAVGILAQGANSAGIRNVMVRSSDGSGTYGIWLPIGPAQGCYHDITVTGFDYGVAQTAASGTNGCFENLTIRNQNKAGLLVTQASFVARNVLADESGKPNVPAALMNDDGAQLLIIDSNLLGGGVVGDAGAFFAAVSVASASKDSLFVRNVMTSGYPNAVSYGGAVVAAGPNVAEYSSASETLFDGGAKTSLDLTVEQVPIGTWGDPASDWASVESFRDAGSTDGGEASDTTSAQAALSSGKPVVIFPKAAYATTSALHVPASVKRIELLYSNFDSGGEIDVTEASADPLVIDNGSGATFSVVAKAQRDIVVRQGSNLTSNPGNLPIITFIENGGSGYGADFAPSNGKVWARGLDIEYRTGAEFVASGGTLWIMGYKTEGSATVLSASGGSSVEVLSGYSFLYSTPPNPMIVNDASSVSFIGSQTANNVTFTPVVSETQGGVTRTANAASFPGYVNRGANDFIVPLYLGRVP